jgi:hypothetical protein
MREVPARPLLRLPELGAMASSSALANEAVCLNAMRILAGRDRGDERQNHNNDPGHRCRLSVHEELDQRGDLQSRGGCRFAIARRRGSRSSGVGGRAGGGGAGPSNSARALARASVMTLRIVLKVRQSSL